MCDSSTHIAQTTSSPGKTKIIEVKFKQLSTTRGEKSPEFSF
jgi:hypothetical protein